MYGIFSREFMTMRQFHVARLLQSRRYTYVHGVFVVQDRERSPADYESSSRDVDARTTDGDYMTSPDRDATETMRTERLFVELEELSKCRAAVCGEVDLCELPDLEEVDARERLREGQLFQQAASAAVLPSTAEFDSELGLD